MTAEPKKLRCPNCQSDYLEVFISIKKSYGLKRVIEYTEGQDEHDLKRHIKKVAKTKKGVHFEKDFKVEGIICHACHKSSTLEEILKGAES